MVTEKALGEWGGGGSTGYLVDTELSLETAAVAVVEGHLHGVLDVAHLVAPHFILDVQSNHCVK